MASPSRIATRLARLTCRRPGLVLLIALALSAALVPPVLRIRLDADITRLVPQSRAEAQAFGRFARSFTAEQVLIALIESEDVSALEPFADRYATALGQLPEVAEVRHRLSPASALFVRDHLTQLLTVEEIGALAAKVGPEALDRQARKLRSLLLAPGGSSLQPILTADPLQLLDTVSQRLSSGLPVDTRSGYFKSKDGHALILYVRPRVGTFDAEADRRLIADAARLARELGARLSDGDFSGRGLEVGFTGAAAYTLTYRDWLHRDASLSTPLSGLAVLVLFAFFFRSLRVLPLVAAPLGVGLLWTGAAASLFFGHVNAVSLTFGTVLLSIGIDFPIQIYNRLREELTARPPKEALEHTMAILAGPSLAAALGPAAVFFACGLSDYRGLAELGVLAGVGLVLNLVAMLTVFPSLLAILPSKLWARAQPPVERGLLAALGSVAARRPARVLAVAALIGALGVPLVARVRFDRKLISFHPPSMPPVRVEAELSRRFGERERMLVALVEGAPEAALLASDRWMSEGDALRAQGLLRGSQSVSTLFPSEATQRARAAAWQVLGAARIAKELRAALDKAGLDGDAFKGFLDQLALPPARIRLADAERYDLGFLARNHVHDEGGVRRVATFLFAAPDRSAEARRALTAFARTVPGSVVTGTPILEDVLRDIVVRDTQVVTAVSALGIALLLALYYRRWRPFVAVMLPLALAWIGFGAALGALGLPLNLFNLLAVPLVIGYGIDDHVFLVHRHEADPARDPARTLATTGRAIVLTSLSTIAGFAGLGIARFDGLKLFGVSGALAVLFCLLGAFAVLPALLAVLFPAARADDSR